MPDAALQESQGTPFFQAHETFRYYVALLVEECGGNQAEAARRMESSASFICNVLAGKGPRDPHSASWAKLRTALGPKAPAWMLDAGRGIHTPSDRVEDFCQFVLGLPDKQREAFFSLAEALGWGKPGESGGD